MSIHGISNEHGNNRKNHKIVDNYIRHTYSIQRNDDSTRNYQTRNIWHIPIQVSEPYIEKKKGGKLDKHYKVDYSINTKN